MADQLTREDIAAILEGVGSAVDGINQVASAIREQDRRTRWATRVGVVGVLVVIFIGGLSYSNRQVVNALEDCTRPGGQCYAESQRRTAAIVGPIGQKLDRIEERGNDNRRLLCAAVDPANPVPVDLCATTTTR